MSSRPDDNRTPRLGRPPPLAPRLAPSATRPAPSQGRPAAPARSPARPLDKDDASTKRPGLFGANGSSRRMSSLEAAGVGGRTSRAGATGVPISGTSTRMGPPSSTGGSALAKKSAAPRASTTGAAASPASVAKNGTAIAGKTTTGRPTASVADPVKPKAAAPRDSPRKLQLRSPRAKADRDDAGSVTETETSFARSMSPTRSERPKTPDLPASKGHRLSSTFSSFTLKSPPKLRLLHSEAGQAGRGHHRSQSESVPSKRPSTAPSGPTDEQMLKEARIMSDFLREINLRETMQSEIRDLHAQVERLQAEKEEWTQDSVKSPPRKIEERGADFARWKAEAKEEVVELRNVHAKELSALRKDVETQRRGVEEEHANELRRLRAEKQKLEAASADHEKAAKQLRTDLEKAEGRARALNSAKTKELADVQAQLKAVQGQLDQARKQELASGEQAKTEHAAQLAEAQKKIQSLQAQLGDSEKRSGAAGKQLADDHARASKDLQSAHSSEISALKKKLTVTQAEHDKQVAALNKDIEKQRKAAESTSKQLEQLKSSHEQEVSQLRSDLENYQKDTSKLSGVESRIADVQSALEQSRSAATDNEKDLQRQIELKEHDHEQLAKTIRDLELEIDRCQKQLDADSVKIKEETDVLRKATATAEATAKKLQKETVTMRKQHDKEVSEIDAVRQKLEEDLAAMTKENESQREDLKKAASDAKESAVALQKELETLKELQQREAVQTEQSLKTSQDLLQKMRTDAEAAEKRHAEQLAQASEHATETERLSEALRDELQTLKDKELSAEEQLVRAGEHAAETDRLSQALRDELQALKDLSAEESAKRASDRESHDSVVTELRDQLQALQLEGSDGAQIVANLQAELQKLEQARAEAENENSAKLEKLNSMIKNMQDEAREFETLNEQLKKELEETNESMNEEAATATSIVKSLRKQIKEMKHEAAQLNKTHDGKIEELNGDISALQKQVSDGEGMSKLVDDLNEKLEALQKEAESSRSSHADQSTELEKALEDKSAQVAAKETEVAELKSRVDELEQAATNAQEAAHAEVETLQRELHTLKESQTQDSENRDADIDAFKKDIAELEKSLELAKDAEAAAISKAEEATAEIERLKTQFDEHEESQARDEETRNGDLVALQQMTVELEAQLNEARKRADQASLEAKNALDQLQELLASVDAFDDIQATQSRGSAAKDAEIAELQGMLEKLQTGLETAAAEDVEAKDELLKQIADEQRARAEELSTMREAHEKEMQELASKIESDSSAPLKELQERHDALATAKEDLERVLQEAGEKGAEAARDAAAKSGEVDKLQSDISALETSLRELQDKNDTLATEKEDLEHALQEAVEESTDASRDAAEKSQQVEELIGQLTLLETTHVELQKQHDVLAVAKEDLEQVLTESAEKGEAAFEDAELARREAESLRQELTAAATASESAKQTLQNEYDTLSKQHEALRAEFEKNHARHVEEIEALQQKLAATETSSDSAASTLQSEYDTLSSQHEALRTEFENNHAKHTDEYDALLSQHAEKVESLQKQLSAAKASTDTSSKALQDEYDTLSSQHDALRTEFERNHEKHTADYDALLTQHAQDKKALENRYAAPFKELSDKYATLERQKDAAEYAVITLREKHADELLDMQDKHDQEIEAVEAKVQKLTEQVVSVPVSTAADGELTAKYESLNDEWLALKAQIQSSQQQHAQELTSLHADYAAQISALTDQLAALERETKRNGSLGTSTHTTMTDLTSHGEDTGDRDVETLKARCADLELALEISQQLADTERERLGSLRRKLIGGVLIGSDGEMEDDPFAAASGAAFGDFEAENGSDGAMSESGEQEESNGLEDKEEGEGEEETENSLYTYTPVIPSSTPSRSTPQTPTADPRKANLPKTPKQQKTTTATTSLEATLASLRVQAKQLEDLNEEFLLESSRWSSSLSPVRGFQNLFGTSSNATVSVDAVAAATPFSSTSSPASSRPVAKEVLRKMSYSSSASPEKRIEAGGMRKMSGRGVIARKISGLWGGGGTKSGGFEERTRRESGETMRRESGETTMTEVEDEGEAAAGEGAEAAEGQLMRSPRRGVVVVSRGDDVGEGQGSEQGEIVE